MRKVDVKTGRSYSIYIEHGIISETGKYVREITKAVRAVIISDTNVAPLYAACVQDSLNEYGFETSVFVFEAGEERKRLSTVEQMYAFLAEHNITRGDIIVALGGGVTGDMAGFAAATWLRGISFVQIPTTLLSQVDSSVGGKTAVDLSYGKNLVGAFWQPSLVLIDPDTLTTLPDRFMRDGFGEVIKYGCIRSKALFERLADEDSPDLDDIIYECVSIKRDVVENDERDTGERAILNFGHTFGHALEKLYKYSGITHGEAVAAGALLLTEITERKGMTAPGTAEKLRSLLIKYGLPTETPYTLKDILPATSGDKKSSGHKLSFVFLRNIGDCFIYPVRISELEDFFN